jgi:spermidine synthase
MNGLQRVKSVLEFHEHDKDQGVERTYLYYKNSSTHIHTEKQEVDIIESIVWGKMLFLDGTLQSTTKDEVIYHNALVHPLMSTLQSKARILILGGGEGATAREVLRWKAVERLVMVDYDKELVDYMKIDKDWSHGAYNDRRLMVVCDDAWRYMKNTGDYDGIIIDLTDPSLKTESWDTLLKDVMESVKPNKGGFVMNAGLYLPWKTEKLNEIVNLIESLCMENPDYKYYMYTAMIPSFNGEWTFICMAHKSKFMGEPEHLDIIPSWIRRSIRTLDTAIIKNPVSVRPALYTLV